MTRLSKTIDRTWSSIREAWRSTLSWMRWRRRADLRRAQERELLLEQVSLLLAWEQSQTLEQVSLLLLEHRTLLLQETRALLLEALSPLAQALSRQDSLLLARTAPLEEMLLELLQQQPTTGSRMREELGIRSRT